MSTAVGTCATRRHLSVAVVARYPVAECWQLIDELHRLDSFARVDCNSAIEQAWSVTQVLSPDGTCPCGSAAAISSVMDRVVDIHRSSANCDIPEAGSWLSSAGELGAIGCPPKA